MRNFQLQASRVPHTPETGKKSINDTEVTKGFLETLNEYVSLQGRANSMFFGSTNILNTERDPIQAGQFAQFLGASIDFTFREWKLSTSYDYAWFRFYDRNLSDGDFNNSTIRQAFSYEKFFLTNKASYTFQPSWQYTSLLNRASGEQFFQQLTYGLGNELAFFPTPWLIQPRPVRRLRNESSKIWFPTDCEQFWILP